MPKHLLSRFLVWWYETESIHLTERLRELEADARRIERDLKDVRARLIKSELRQLQHAEPV